MSNENESVWNTSDNNSLHSISTIERSSSHLNHHHWTSTNTNKTILPHTTLERICDVLQKGSLTLCASVQIALGETTCVDDCVLLLYKLVPHIQTNEMIYTVMTALNNVLYNPAWPYHELRLKEELVLVMMVLARKCCGHCEGSKSLLLAATGSAEAWKEILIAHALAVEKEELAYLLCSRRIASNAWSKWKLKFQRKLTRLFHRSIYSKWYHRWMGLILLKRRRVAARHHQHYKIALQGECLRRWYRQTSFHAYTKKTRFHSLSSLWSTWRQQYKIVTFQRKHVALEKQRLLSLWRSNVCREILKHSKMRHLFFKWKMFVKADVKRRYDLLRSCMRRWMVNQTIIDVRSRALVKRVWSVWKHRFVNTRCEQRQNKERLTKVLQKWKKRTHEAACTTLVGTHVRLNHLCRVWKRWRRKALRRPLIYSRNQMAVTYCTHSVMRVAWKAWILKYQAKHILPRCQKQKEENVMKQCLLRWRCGVFRRYRLRLLLQKWCVNAQQSFQQHYKCVVFTRRVIGKTVLARCFHTWYTKWRRQGSLKESMATVVFRRRTLRFCFHSWRIQMLRIRALEAVRRVNKIVVS
eukprot:PhF_6_TR41673/c0_g1_i1/m.63185